MQLIHLEKINVMFRRRREFVNNSQDIRCKSMLQLYYIFYVFLDRTSHYRNNIPFNGMSIKIILRNLKIIFLYRSNIKKKKFIFMASTKRRPHPAGRQWTSSQVTSLPDLSRTKISERCLVNIVKVR